MEEPAPAAKIVLVENHTILREGVRALIELESDLRVVGEASSAAEAIQVVQHTRPSLVITDLAMPGGLGLPLIERLRAFSAGIRVLVLTAYYADEYVCAAREARADGYLLKQTCRVELLRAIRTIAAGHRYFSEVIAASQASGYVRRGEHTDGALPLTEREREVLKDIARGDSNKHIARTLSLSVKTVEKHRANLMRKLELHNTAAVTLFAVRNGLVPALDLDRCVAQECH